MKRFVLIAAGLILLGGGALFARGMRDGDACEACFRKQQGKQIEKHLKKMTKELNLTADQQAAAKAAMEEKWDKKWALKKDMSDKMDALRDETTGKIKAALTPDQLTKFEEMHEKKNTAGHRHPYEKGCCSR